MLTRATQHEWEPGEAILPTAIVEVNLYVSISHNLAATNAMLHYSLAKVNFFKLSLHFQVQISVVFSAKGMDVACIFAFIEEAI